ncbi:MAG: TIGR03960 family B12-binding radical SAM protein [Chloroflexota bacterium]|nr:MAG: TIGR03960 family B12-binding radical SAM protein [Chloroflexota bacterium]
MVSATPNIEARLQRILPTVRKPGRYTGGELNQVLKDWDQVDTHVALVFPDIYDLGMSNLGLAILYEILNRRQDTLAERVFSPWIDMEAALRDSGIPLYSLESKHPVADFDILGISLPYETLYTNTLNMLDLAGIPLFSAQRTETDPLIIAGGHATFNPEPMHPFIDAFVIGEGEEVINEIVDTHQDWKLNGSTRDSLLEDLALLEGVYVPSFYETRYNDDDTLAGIDKINQAASLPVLKRIVPELPPPPTKLIVPYVDTVHNRIPIEIMRGCTRGCRFCHAGMVTRPVRERSVEEIVEAIEEGVANTGFEEIGLLSLSSSDYTHILDLVKAVNQRFSGRHLSISLPSLRIETVSVDLMDQIMDERRSGFTLAPEAATEKMRQIINKPVSTQQVLDTAREVYSRGWPTLKLYFMIGHPSETLEDVQAIIDLCKAVLKEGRQVIGRRAKLHAGVSTFVPKPHTPFQWSPSDTKESILAKQELLKSQLRGKGLKLTWTDPDETMVEAWLSRGDRRLAEVVYQAWLHGAKFDAWKDQHDFQAWMNAFDKVGLNPDFYTHRERNVTEVLPWDHISTSVRKQFMVQDLFHSQEGETLDDCRHSCYACGVLPTFADARREHPGEGWGCPDVSQRGKKSELIQVSVPTSDA